MRLEAVTFDCWGTLITDHEVTRAAVRGEPARTRSGTARMRALIEAAQGELTEEEAWNVLDGAWRTHFEAWTSGVQYGSSGMAKLIAEEMGLGEREAELCRAFEEAGLEGSIEALPGARDTLVYLREQGLATALVCDSGFTPGRCVRQLLEAEGLLELLDECVFSDEVGVPKPHLRMFSTALSALDVRPEVSIHVGDLRRTDVAGARAAGMGTVRIAAVHDDSPDPPIRDADHVVGSHEELVDLLKRLRSPD